MAPLKSKNSPTSKNARDVSKRVYYSDLKDTKPKDGNKRDYSSRFTFTIIAVLGCVISIVYLRYQASFYESFWTGENLLVSSVVTIHTEFVPLDPAAFSNFIDNE
ncbi:hypothetical protein SK128_003432, partial [Halocaridina rubra]